MEKAVVVIMRVPGLFIIDHWWMVKHKAFPTSLELGDITYCILINFLLLHGLLLLLLPVERVRILYTHYISVALLISCERVSDLYINAVMKKEDDDLRRHMFVLAFHAIAGCFVSCLLKSPWNTFPPVSAIYTLPVLTHLCDFPVKSLPFLHNFCTAVTGLNVFFYITYQLPNLVDYAKQSYSDALTNTEFSGISSILTQLWDKLFIPDHFAVFWLISFFVTLADVLYGTETVSSESKWYMVLLSTACNICYSPVTLVATSVTVSYLSFFTLCLTRAYLQGYSAFFQHNPLHSGWTEGILLILLSVQTGLIEWKMPGRMGVMAVILFIVLSTLLQSMVEIMEPIVLALAASRSHGLLYHFRVLSMCCVMLIFPLYIAHLLMLVFSIEFWVVIVYSSCCLTSIKVLDILVVYSLLLYDSSRAEPWDNLDDIVYYTRAVAKVLEFAVAIMIVGVGIWVTVVTKLLFLNLCALLCHSYLNVWQRWQTGWKSFCLRREASKKINSLPSATQEQLSQLDDVCSICHGNLKAACVTPCQHFFHRTCLRKWLFVQDKCPLCHGKVYESIANDSVSSQNNAG